VTSLTALGVEQLLACNGMWSQKESSVIICFLTGFFTLWVICTLPGCSAGISDRGVSSVGPAALPTPSPTLLAKATSYLTWKNDNARTGLQPKEMILTPATVNQEQFGEKFSYPLDGWAYAQPLYVGGLTIENTRHNVLFVATENDSVYALDADNPRAPLWHKSFLGPGITTGPIPYPRLEQILSPTGLGITSTPVIDLDSETIYVEAETFENGSYAQKLHALDIHTGSERAGSPVLITAGGFDPKQEFNRAALLLAKGNIYVGFAFPYADNPPYHGWLFAFDAVSLKQVAYWNDTPAGGGDGEGGIWMGGAGPAADEDGNVYVSTANGTWNGTTDFAMSVVKLDAALHVLDYFTPFNAFELSDNDQDIGSGGVLLLPKQAGALFNEIVACGKPDPIYVLNRDSMGHKGTSDDSQVIQSLAKQSANGPAGANWLMTPAYFQQKLYFIGANNVIKAFSLDAESGKLSVAPVSKGSLSFLWPGAQPVVSSNGATNGIVWAVDSWPEASLHAFDANDVSHELYRSFPIPGGATKYSVPTIIHGHVYVAAKNRLVVFGLLWDQFNPAPPLPTGHR
jgi:PQQ-like domain